MNGAEFFMRYAGYALMPASLATGDAVLDARTLFGLSLPLSTGSSLRLSSCWMVVTPSWVATSFKLVPKAGWRLGGERRQAMLSALRGGGPCLIVAAGKRSLSPRDLFVTHDPRAVRLCSEGAATTFDATREKWWTS